MKFIADHKLNKYRNLRTRFVLSDIAGCTAVLIKHYCYKVLEYKPTYMLMHDTWVLESLFGSGWQCHS